MKKELLFGLDLKYRDMLFEKLCRTGMRIIFIVTVFLITTHLKAEEKFAINGDILTYRTDQNEDSEGITLDDVAVFKSLLKANTQVRVVKLSSGGGEVAAAYEILDVVIEQQLDTHVIDFCESACTLILLAGVNRTAEKNAKIGFHQTSLSPADAKLEYKELKGELGFETPYDYASWLLEDTQDLILNDLYYYQSLGLSLDFIIKTMEAYSDEMWYPDHAYMVEEGVLTE